MVEPSRALCLQPAPGLSCVGCAASAATGPRKKVGWAVGKIVELFMPFGLFCFFFFPPPSFEGIARVLGEPHPSTLCAGTEFEIAAAEHLCL